MAPDRQIRAFWKKKFKHGLVLEAERDFRGSIAVMHLPPPVVVSCGTMVAPTEWAFEAS